MLGIVDKQPVEVLDYDIDFKRWLVDDQIDAAVATIEPSDTLVVDTIDISEDATLVKVWLSGGQSGTKYKVEVTVDTQGGRRGQVEFTVRCRER